MWAEHLDAVFGSDLSVFRQPHTTTAGEYLIRLDRSSVSLWLFLPFEEDEEDDNGE